MLFKVIMNIIMCSIIEWIRKQFSSNKKEVIKYTVAGAGVIFGSVGIVNKKVANQKNEEAKEIIDSLNNKTKEVYDVVQSSLEKLGNTELNVYNNNMKIADLLEQIQKRPDINFKLGDINLPSIQDEELKRLPSKLQSCIGTGLSAIGGCLIGLATVGSKDYDYVPSMILFSGTYLLCDGNKSLKQSNENLENAKEFEIKANKTIKFYQELNDIVINYNSKLSLLELKCKRYIEKLEMILERKNNWEKFSNTEKKVVKITIMLAQLLLYMCGISIINKTSRDDSYGEINTTEINEDLADVDKIMKQQFY